MSERKKGCGDGGGGDEVAKYLNGCRAPLLKYVTQEKVTLSATVSSPHGDVFAQDGKCTYRVSIEYVPGRSFSLR